MREDKPTDKRSRQKLILLSRLFGTMVGIVFTSSVSLTGTTLILINYQSQNVPCSAENTSVHQNID